MTSTRSYGRPIFRFVSTTTWLWAVCLSLMWARRFGLREPVILICMSASLAAFALGMIVPGQVFWLSHATLIKLVGISKIWFAPRSKRPDSIAKSPNKFYAIAVLVAVLLCFIAALSTFAAGQAYLRISSSILPSGRIMFYLQWTLFFLAMIPWGLAAALINRAHGRFAHSRQSFSIILETSWPMSAVGACAIAIASVAGGIDPVLLGFVAGFLQFVTGYYLYNRSGRRETLPPEIPASTGRLSNRHRYAAFVLMSIFSFSVLLSIKSLGMLLGVGLWGRLGLMATVLALASLLYSRWISLRFTHSGKVSAGAAILTGSAMCIHIMLVACALSSSGADRLLVIMALGSLIFVIAGVVVLILSCRHWYLATGGADRSWRQLVPLGLSAAAAMVAAGPVQYITGPVLVVLILAWLAVSIMSGIFISRRMRGQLVWSVCGAAVMLLLGVSLISSVSLLRRNSQMRLAIGNWLDAWQIDTKCGYWPADRYRNKMTPYLHSLMCRKASVSLIGSRWLVVDQSPVSSDITRAAINYCVADSSISRLPAWDGTSPDRIDLCLGNLRRGQYHGILYSPVSVCNNNCGELYSSQIIMRLYRSLVRNGVLIIHFDACDISAEEHIYRHINKLCELPGDIKIAIRRGPDIEAAVFISRTKSHKLSPLENIEQLTGDLPCRWMTPDEFSAAFR